MAQMFRGILILGILWGTGCHTRPDAPFNTKTVKTNLPQAFDTTAANMVGNYIALKNALVKADAAASDRSARLLQAGIHRLQAAGAGTDTLLQPALLQTLDSMDFQLTRIIAYPDPGCEQQRIFFKYLSDQVLIFIKQADAKGLQLYSQYCPMALNETGAWWLSTSTDIKNPYFGDRMLTCGEVVDTFR